MPLAAISRSECVTSSSRSGFTARAAETIFQIVPREDQLVFSGVVLPSDIDRVEQAKPLRIRLSAFNEAGAPEIKGEVTFVSPDSVTDDTTGARLFRVRL